MRQRRLGVKKIFNFPMFHITSHLAQFQGISNPLSSKIWKQDFSNSVQITITPLNFVGFSRKKIPQRCNINTQKEREHRLCKLPELVKNQAQIQVFESTTQNITKFLEPTLDRPPCLDIVWNYITGEAIKRS